VIQILAIQIHGKSEKGDFVGRLEFAPGLQVISGRNNFGKSLAAEAIAWCLGIEMIFGRKESDPTFLPEAVLEELSFPQAKNVRVISSEACLSLLREDGERVELARGITHDRNKVRIRHHSSIGESNLTLQTGSGSLAEQASGFQRFLFEWFGWPIKQATTFEGRETSIYLENLAPLFYVEQEEGWTEIQARQVGRYAQQQIRELSVEYLLGALETVEDRVARQRTATRENALRAAARTLADQVTQTFLKQGWAVDWTGNGSLREIEARWSANTLKQVLQRDVNFDLKKQRDEAMKRVAELRRIATLDTIDPSNMTAGPSASQRVVDLKYRRHKLNSEMRALHGQYLDSQHLVESLDHRIQTATDVHRLKTTGVGRLTHLECPTCHRELDIDAFSLNDQTAPEVQAHIEALKRDRTLTRQTLRALHAAIRTTEAEIQRLDSELHNAQRVLEDVTSAVGPVREQIVQAAANLHAEERLLEKLRETEETLSDLQTAINQWLKDAQEAKPNAGAGTDIEHRLSVFAQALGQYLTALGHGAVGDYSLVDLRLDPSQYEPYIGRRRLRALGSGSDPARLVGAYTLALAAAAVILNGLHPGFVILDEPLQQNPDTHHRQLFLEFLSNDLAKNARFQTLVFTSLRSEEVDRLRDSGTLVITVEGHLLQPVPNEANEEGPRTVPRIQGAEVFDDRLGEEDFQRLAAQLAEDLSAAVTEARLERGGTETDVLTSDASQQDAQERDSEE
jgi:hypothetical protein